MIAENDRFVVDEQGNRTAVLIEVERYFKLLEAAEELATIRAYDEAKASGDEVIPFAGGAGNLKEAKGI